MTDFNRDHAERAEMKNGRVEEPKVFGLADALGTEYRAIIDAGLDLQVDRIGIFTRAVCPVELRHQRRTQ